MLSYRRETALQGALYSVSQNKVAPPPLKLFCDVFTCGEPV